ncbi:MAG: 3-methylcrotonyl-CoA carboxylase, partial [Mesorhizobium sp.]
QQALTAVPPPSSEIVAAAAFAASGAGTQAPSNDPWSSLAGYSHFHTVPRRTRLRYGDDEIVALVSVRPDKRFQVALDAPYDSASPLDLRAAPRLARWPGHVTVFSGAIGYSFAVPDPLARADEIAAGSDSLRAPMPGLVKLVRAARGEAVIKGQPLLILEAMKMEHTISATHDGTIAEIAAEGAQVTDGTVLVRFAEEAHV